MYETALPIWLRGILSSIATFSAYLLGANDDWLCALIVFVVLDYATGVMAAISNGTLSSAQGFKGILRKVAIFAVVAVANIFDNAMGVSGVIRTVVILFFCANEGLSILENCAKLGLPIPQKLIEALEQLRKENER